MAQSRLYYHVVAFLTVAVWGSTFVITKMLLTAGISPVQIFTLRFIIAYVLLLLWQLLVSNRGRRMQWMCDTPADEWLMVALGVTGGSAYFLAENSAMLFTTATNTSLIVCSCPLFAMFLIAAVYRQTEHISRVQLAGSLMACVGMAVVVLNGHFVLHLSPVGDMLAFVACICWAVYSLLMKRAAERYSTIFITRKVFFYGLLTIIPYYIIEPGFPSMQTLTRPDVMVNLLFLGVVASMICFLLWNWVIRRLGAMVATNWVYFNPITTIIFAWWLLSEKITLWFAIGSALIITGMYLCERRQR